MDTTTVTRTNTISTTKLIVATVAAVVAGGVAFAVTPVNTQKYYIGACIVKKIVQQIPSYVENNSGTYYNKKNTSINVDYNQVLSYCSEAVYKPLQDDFCNQGKANKYKLIVATYNQNGTITANGCASQGCDERLCPSVATNVPNASQIISQCGQIISQPGTYYLANNIMPTQQLQTGTSTSSASSSTTKNDVCISINSSGVTLDCKNYSLSGQNNSNYLNYGIKVISPISGNSLDNVIIKNCKVDGFLDSGIVLSSANNTRINSLEIGDSLYKGLVVLNSNNTLVTNTYFYHTNKLTNSSLRHLYFENSTGSDLSFTISNSNFYSKNGNSSNDKSTQTFNLDIVGWVKTNISLNFAELYLIPSIPSFPVDKVSFKEMTIMFTSPKKSLSFKEFKINWLPTDLIRDGKQYFDPKSMNLFSYGMTDLSWSPLNTSLVINSLSLTNFSADAFNLFQIFQNRCSVRGVTDSWPQQSFTTTPISGSRPLLIILWDPQRPGQSTFSEDYIEQAFFGSDPSISKYFESLSHGKFQLQKAKIVGWYTADKSYTYYWGPLDLEDKNENGILDPGEDTNNNGKLDLDLDGNGFFHPHAEKISEAVKKADKDFDFSVYDTNKDGDVTRDELGIVIIIPQSTVDFGTKQYVVSAQYPVPKPLEVDGVKVYEAIEWYAGLHNGKLELNTGIHELSHLLLNLGDMYFKSFNPYEANIYSMMGLSYYNNHIDPRNKLGLGWLNPKIISGSGCYSINSMDKDGELYLLYNKLRGTKEYFLIENRQMGQYYDDKLLDTGLAVWHIIEDYNVYSKFLTPPGMIEADWKIVTPGEFPRRGIRLVRPIPIVNNAIYALHDGADTTGSDFNLKWYDGTDSGFTIRNISASGEKMYFDVAAK